MKANSMGSLPQPEPMENQPGDAGRNNSKTDESASNDGTVNRRLAAVVQALLSTDFVSADSSDDDAARRVLSRWQQQIEPPSLGQFGEFELQQQIGSGGFGRVYRAWDKAGQRCVAIKVLCPKDNFIEAAIRFHRETEIALRLSHPNIIRGFVDGDIDGRSYLAMEYASGGSLRDVLKRQGAIAWREAVAMAIDVARGLHYLYQLKEKYVHRDIKPSNLLMMADGSVKIADFGLVRSATGADDDCTSLTATGWILGSRPYMAPEQTENSSVHIRADIYSLGCVLVELICGRRHEDLQESLTASGAIVPNSLATVVSDVPEQLDAVVCRMLAELPEERFQTPAEVEAALSAVAGIPSALSSKETGRGVARRAWLAGAAVLALGLTGATIWTLRNRPGQQQTLYDSRDEWEPRHPTKHSQVEYQAGEWILRNRGWLVSKQTFPEGVSLEFDWEWTEGEGTYSDNLTVGLRTSGQPGNINWARELEDGLRVIFQPDPPPGTILVFNATTNEQLTAAWGPELPKANQLHIRLRAQGRALRVFLDHAKLPVLVVTTPDNWPQYRVAIYNRERVANVDKLSRIKDLRVSSPES